jgi:NifU-like protein involved in Fe-S cluster formation
MWGVSTGLYSNDILTLAQSLRDGELQAPDTSVRRVAKLCGSEIDLELSVRDGVVTEFAQRVRACALGQASAAILAESIKGATASDIQSARDALYAMLKSDGPAPSGRFAKLALLQDVKRYPARHQSVLLAWEAALEAIETL